MIGPRVLVLSSALDASPRCVHLGRPMTIGEVVATEKVSLGLPTIAVLTDPAGKAVPVLRGEWHVRQVTPGYTLAFVPVPGRGAMTSILAAVASIALAVFAPWAAGALATAFFGGSQIAAGVIGAGIMIAGQFIINRLMPRQSSLEAAEATYTAKASSNRAMPMEPVPELFGRLRYPPPFAARPYAEFVDNDQYLYQLHCLSVGHVDVERWEIGDTLVWTKAGGFQGSFAGGDTEIEIVRPGEQVTLFPANVISAPTVDGQQVPDSPAKLGPFTVNPPGTTVSKIACDYVFPLGLVSVNKKGGGDSLSRTISAEYRAIDDAGDPVGDWTPLFTQTHAASTRTPQRKTRGVNVPAGRYEVRLGASGQDQADATGGPPNNLNRVLWAGLRGYVADFVTPPDCTLVATKIRATEHLSREAAGQYLMTAQRLLPTWSEGGGWSAPTATRSPAWAAAHMLRSLGLADHEYDLGWLAAYAGVWATRGDRFDAIFDRRWQASEALDAILHVGRSYHVRLGSIIGFVRDEAKHVRRVAFTPDNIVSGSVRRHDIWFSEDAPDHLEVVYLDGEVWQERTVMAAIGAIGADKPQQEPAFGITDHDHAWREGIFKAAENAFRRSFRSFQVEREGRMLVRGDPVVLHDPVFNLASFARLDGRDGDVLTIDRDVDVDDAETYHVILRDKRGREWGPCLVASFDGREITLDAGDRATVAGRHGLLSSVLPNIAREEPAHVAILKGDQRLFDGLVVEARPVGSELWDITLVADDQRVHAVDETEVIPSPWTPPALLAPVPDRPTVTGLYAAILRGTLGVTLEAGWLPAAGAERYVAEISYDADAVANPAAASWTPVHDSAATRLSVSVAPQPLALRVAAVGRQQGDWAYTSVIAIPELLLPDEVIDPVRTEMREWTAGQMDWLDEDSPLFPLGTQVHNLDDKMAVVQSELAGITGAADFDPLVAYAEGDLVKYDGGLYRAIVATTGNLPSNPVYWFKIGDYASLGDAVAAVTARVNETETEIEATAGNIRSITRDSRRVHNALKRGAIQGLDKVGAAIAEHADRMLASATAARWTETEISRVDGVLGVHAADIALVKASLANYADVQVVAAMQVAITSQGNLITAQGSNIASIQNALSGYDGSNAIANAMSERYTKTETDAVVGNASLSLAGLIEDVEVSLGNISAGGRIKMESMVSPGGGWTNIGIKASANDGVSFEEAAMLFQARTTGSVRSRAVLMAGQIVVQDSEGNISGLFEAGTAFFDKARIRGLTADHINAAALVASDAFLENLRIGNAQIDGDLTFGAERLTLAALARYQQGSTLYPTLDRNTWTTRTTLTVGNPSGNPVTVMVRGGGNIINGSAEWRVLRGSTVIAEYFHNPINNESYHFSDTIPDVTPGVGTATYTLQTRTVGGSSTTTMNATMTCTWSLR